MSRMRGIYLIIVATCVLVVPVCLAQKQTVQSHVTERRSPDGAIVAIISSTQAPEATDESRVELRTRDEKLLARRDYTSEDGEHGYGVTKAAWTADSQFFVYSLVSSGGHQAWHLRVHFFARRDNKMVSLDDALNDAVTSPQFSLSSPDRVTVELASTRQTKTVSLSSLPRTRRLPGQTTRFFKAEGGVSADYLKLAKDGTYRVIAREHMGVELAEEGQWEQEGALVTFRPQTLLRGGKLTNVEGTSYQGTEVEYKGRTFIAWKSEGAPGIVIPSEETEQQLDGDPKTVPEYVFFKTTAKVYAEETKHPYPFRYLRPND